MMRCKQKGATLLEMILVAAVMGMIFSYTGRLMLQEAEKKSTIKAANQIINMQYIVDKYTKDIIWNTDLVNGKDTMVNPLFESTSLQQAWYYDVTLFKNKSCSSANQIPEIVTDVYLTCTQTLDIYPLQYVGVSVAFESYTNLKYPTVKRQISKERLVYASTSRGEMGPGLNIVAELSAMANSRGINITDDDIVIRKFTNSSSSFAINKYVELDWNMPYGTFISNPDNIDAYIKDLQANNRIFGFSIETENRLDDNLKVDGSAPLEYGAKLCWDSRSGENRPCFGTVTHSAGLTERDTFLFDQGVTYKTNKKYKTPPEVSYHTFSNGKDVYITYLECVDASDVLILKNKLVLIPSSFSSGSENGTNFSDQTNIVSRGTKGANGKHSMMTGLSLEYTNDTSKRMWVVKGALGIDGAYAAANNNSSVLRNPSSISFAAIRWCEE